MHAWTIGTNDLKFNSTGTRGRREAEAALALYIAERHRMRIVFFGDSITNGYGVSPHRTWVNRLSVDLENLITPPPIVAVCGVNGNTTRQALERMPFDVQSDGVRVIFIQFGLNDCNYWQTDAGVPRVSARAFEANLIEIAMRSEAHGSRAVFLATNHLTNKMLTGVDVDYQESNSSYNKIIRRTASRMSNVGLIDIEKGFQRSVKKKQASAKNYLMPDGVHLNESGHSLYYEIMSTHIAKNGDLLQAIFAE